MAVLNEKAGFVKSTDDVAKSLLQSNADFEELLGY